MSPTNPNITEYSGTNIPVSGRCIDSIQYKNGTYKVPLALEVTPILGLVVCKGLNLVTHVLAAQDNTAFILSDYPLGHHSPNLDSSLRKKPIVAEYKKQHVLMEKNEPQSTNANTVMQKEEISFSGV